jgi:hypothetical protein
MTSRDLAFSYRGHRKDFEEGVTTSVFDRLLSNFSSPRGLISLSVDDVSIPALIVVLKLHAPTLRSLKLRGSTSYRVLIPAVNQFYEQIMSDLSVNLTSLTIKVTQKTEAITIVPTLSHLSALTSLDIWSAPVVQMVNYLNGQQKLKNLTIRGESLDVHWPNLTSLQYFSNSILAARLISAYFKTSRHSWTAAGLEATLRPNLPPQVCPKEFLRVSNICASRWAVQNGSEYLAADLLRFGFDRLESQSILTQALVRNEKLLSSAASAAGLFDDLDSSQVVPIIFTVLATNEPHNSEFARITLEKIKPQILDHPRPRDVLRDSLGRTALMHLASCSDIIAWDAFEWLLQNREKLQLEINEVDDCGNSALHHLLFNAGWSGSALANLSGMSSISRKLKALLAAGADVSLLNGRGESPSSVATRYGLHELIFSGHFKIDRDRDFDRIFPGELLFRATIERFDGLVKMILHTRKFSTWISLYATVLASAKRSIRWERLIAVNPELVELDLFQVACRFGSFASFTEILRYYSGVMSSSLDFPKLRHLETSPLLLCCQAVAEGTTTLESRRDSRTMEVAGDQLAKLLVLMLIIVSSFDDFSEEGLRCVPNPIPYALDQKCAKILLNGDADIRTGVRDIFYKLPPQEICKERAQLDACLSTLRPSIPCGKFFPCVHLFLVSIKP